MKLVALILLVLTAMALAEEAKQSKTVPEVTRLRIIASYQKALMAQQDLNQKKDLACAKDPDCKKAQDEFTADVTDLQTVYRQAKADLKLPPDEELSVDANARKAEDQVQIHKAQQPAK